MIIWAKKSASPETEEDIRKMMEIQSEFANWAEMKFGYHKCTYWGHNFVRGREEEVTLENFTVCREAISQLEGSEAFKYLGEYKAPASTKTNKKPTLPYGLNEERREVHEGKRALAKYKTRITQLDTQKI